MKSRRVNLGRVAVSSCVLTAIGAVAAGIAGGHPLSVVLGGAFMVGNFHLIRTLISLLMRSGSGRSARVWAGVLLTLKLLLSVLLVAAVIYQFPVASLSFAFGASMLLVAAVLEAALLGEPLGAVDLEPSKS